MAAQLHTTKGAGSIRAQLVKRLGGRLFPCSRFAGDQRRVEVRRDAPDLRKHLQHGRAAPDDSFQLERAQ